MTNKDYMCTLCPEHFEAVMRTLYFKPQLYIQDWGPYNIGIPNMFYIIGWLKETYDPDSKFWPFVLGDQYKPYKPDISSENKDTPFCDGCENAFRCYGVDTEHCEIYKTRARQAI